MSMFNRSTTLLGELKRRGVLRVGVAYLAASWLLIQVADTVFPAFGLPAAALTGLIVVLATGFIPAMILSWKFQLTAAGLQLDEHVPSSSAYSREAARFLDRAVTVLLVIGVGYFALDKFVFDPARDATLVEAARQEGRADALIESYGDRSIAILPFVNMSADPEQEYFSDGMAEEILNLLAKVEELRVISRSSAFSFKDKDIKIPEVAQSLNVAHVLEGSVRRSGSKVRITVQLIDARTDTHLWSETYDRELDDVFAIQDEIAAAVTGQLKISLLGDAPTATRVDPQAFALYLQARYLFNTFVSEDQAQAGSLVEQALTIAPDYVPALILKLRTIRMSDENWLRSPEFLGLSSRIVALDPYNAHGNSIQSWVALYVHGDVPSAARFLMRAMSRPSTDLEFLRGTSTILRGLGLNAEAIAVQAYVVDRDPTCAQCRYLLASSLRDMGQFDKAEGMLQSAVAMSPEDSPFGYALARTQLLNGKPQAALDYAEGAAEHNHQITTLALMARHSLGRVADATAALDTVTESVADEDPLPTAEALAWLGESSRAFDYLENMETFHDFSGAWHSPFFSSLHHDPRWLALLERRGVAPKQLEALDIRIQLPPGVRITRN